MDNQDTTSFPPPSLTTLTALLTTGLTTYLLFWIWKPRLDPKLSKIPGPFLNSLSALPAIWGGITGKSIYNAERLFEQYGKVVRTAPNTVMCCDKEDVWKVLVEKDCLKDDSYALLRKERDVSNVFNELERGRHRVTRRLMSSGFSISYLNGLEGVMQDCLQEFVTYVDEKCAEAGPGGEAVIDISLLLGNLAFDIQASTSLGGSFHLVLTNDTRIKAAFTSALFRLVIECILPFLKWFRFSKKDELESMMDTILEKRKLEIENGEKKKDILQCLLDAHEQDPENMTTTGVRENTLVFMIAGSDTSGVTATFTLLLLVNNPDKLELLKKELDEAFPGKEQGNITFKETQELPYLNAVINESMRCMPITAGGIPRKTSEPLTISGYDIPAGTKVVPCPSILSKDPSIWPDADSFVPERWLGEYKGKVVDKKAFLPFSAGSRNCIGQQFALKELRIILATIVRRYELVKIEGQSEELRYHIVPWFLQGFYNLGFKVREE